MTISIQVHHVFTKRVTQCRELCVLTDAMLVLLRHAVWRMKGRDSPLRCHDKQAVTNDASYSVVVSNVSSGRFCAVTNNVTN